MFVLCQKTKGVSALIEIENPNRVAVKNKKLSELTIDTTTNVAPQLSRRERWVPYVQFLFYFNS
jgi:hypothetical protein